MPSFWVDSRDELRGAQIKVAPEIYRAILETASDYDMRIIAHATTLADHKSLVSAGNRRFIHMPYDMGVDDEYLDMVRENNVYIVPTLGMITSRSLTIFLLFKILISTIRFLNQLLIHLMATTHHLLTSVPKRNHYQQYALIICLKIKDHIIFLGNPFQAPVGDFFGYADHVELSLFVRMGMTPQWKLLLLRLPVPLRPLV
ncbi:MAG: hypothetical protein Ct9H300mP22_5840 [Gammaproteobacteria bacterium]|nr:MAG: hypothetical protein Ct9H300mP22_5840 [Gammaproteobacteria bacterium]